ncbi:MAG: helix-turn-helix domain-containing protein [Clostridia bacterium]|nr:helix-turn-helix domain-containing protein [Clostridia bacterium]
MVAETLKKVRKEHNLKQQDVATILGIDRSTYTFYETGKTCPSLPTMIKLAKAYDCTIGYLSGTEENHPERRLKEGYVANSGADGISTLVKEEQLVLMCYRLIPEEKKDEAIEYLRNLAK